MSECYLYDITRRRRLGMADLPRTAGVGFHVLYPWDDPEEPAPEGCAPRERLFEVVNVLHVADPKARDPRPTYYVRELSDSSMYTERRTSEPSSYLRRQKVDQLIARRSIPHHPAEGP